MLSSIRKELKKAMLAKDKDRVNTLRNIIAKLKMKEIEKKDSLTREEAQKVLQSMAKQLNDSIDQYSQGGRLDLAKNESDELEILSEFLPEQLSENEVKEIIITAINDTQASGIGDMGKVMAAVISKTGVKADGSMISQIVKEKLS